MCDSGRIRPLSEAKRAVLPSARNRVCSAETTETALCEVPGKLSSFHLSQKLSQRLPVVGIPSGIEMVEVTIGKSCVIKNEFGSRVLRFQFNLD
jgi:hypothetical protein